MQANFGRRPQLRVAGVPVGREIPQTPAQAANGVSTIRCAAIGSIIIVVATDAPLLPHQLKRLARRAALGLARTGSMSGNGSGDIFLAFSTANPDAVKAEGLATLKMLPNEADQPALRGHGAGHRGGDRQRAGGRRDDDRRRRSPVERLPHDRLREVLKKYNRLAP